MPSAINPPITVPAVDAKVFDEWFFTQFICQNLHNDQLASIQVVQVPRNAASKEFHHAGTETVSGSFWDVVQNVPAAAAAMQATLAALPDVVAYLKTQQV
ncbi:MAG: hypothetical protein IPK32_14005 [Verrucomicrobiaceae bacterium]|nr:hypothetical protein [Verrucomicrobiaceae bacterium]